MLTERINRRLKATGLTRRTASERAGLNPTYLRDIMEGRNRNPRTEHLSKLARVLETSLEWLVEGRGEESPSAEQIEFDRVQALLRRIAPEDLPQAERALRGFVRDDPPAEFQHEALKAPRPRKRPPRLAVSAQRRIGARVVMSTKIPACSPLGVFSRHHLRQFSGD